MKLDSREVVHPQHVRLGSQSSYDPTSDLDTRITEEAWSCTYCKRVTLELVWWTQKQDPGEERPTFGEVRRRVIWPEPVPRKVGPEVPARIRDLFDEAARTESAGAMRLAGAGYRAVVEEICKDRGASGRTLYDKITDLESRGLPSDVTQALHEARMVGNDSLHDGLEYASDELVDIAELVTEVTVILYVQPAQRARLAAARQARRATHVTATGR
ncbi:DUF4145 domain-containing protein [Streptomyces mirabilis]|uniref:DUF4145 domain-containing protein n=1 Tax=Streptomyces mirabilis TaxID=68239 RepID=UPI002E2D77CD|nr:DUF4145 domain-containing protein [Streptomyces mirabilis]